MYVEDLKQMLKNILNVKIAQKSANIKMSKQLHTVVWGREGGCLGLEKCNTCEAKLG